MGERRTVNVGLIGGGGIARLHAIAYAGAPAYIAPDLPPVRHRRVAEADESLARSAAERLRFEEWTADWEALIASPDMTLYFPQYLKPSPDAAWVPTTAFQTQWTAAHGDAPDWFRADPTVKAVIERDGILGIPGLKPE